MLWRTGDYILTRAEMLDITIAEEFATLSQNPPGELTMGDLLVVDAGIWLTDFTEFRLRAIVYTLDAETHTPDALIFFDEGVMIIGSHDLLELVPRQLFLSLQSYCIG